MANEPSPHFSIENHPTADESEPSGEERCRPRPPERNRLAREKSPYLLQHAGNPVDWFPWGPEAFARARAEDKPLFVSIGYSTCHWCHVMERESFEDPEIAALLNRVFVPVKVDREERPDVDHVYMAVCQAMTGSGGWPLTVATDPEGKPFFAATYIPDRPRFGHPGIREVIRRIEEIWQTRRARVNETAREIVAELSDGDAVRRRRGDRRAAAASSDVDAAAEVLFEHYARTFDPVYGGFGAAPKFPAYPTLFFLQRYGERRRQPRALAMVRQTLNALRRGGIWDHVGQGLHRYSTDRRWFVPHFEKMLYDQALATLAFLDAAGPGGGGRLATSARETLDYLRRDLRHPAGGFYAAEDADSEGEEGKFYLWTEQEILAALSEDEAERVRRRFGVRPEGNLGERGEEFPAGANLLHESEDGADESPTGRLSGDGGPRAVAQALSALRKEREKRVRPFLDRKVLTDWNGLAIAALAVAARRLGDESFLAEAKAAAEFVLTGRPAGTPKLRHRYCDGEWSAPGFLDDYAFFGWGLLELYEAAGDQRWLEEAQALLTFALREFAAPDGAGFHFSPPEGENLIIKVRPAYDGALPSGGAALVRNLFRLARLTGDASWAASADAFGRRMLEAAEVGAAAPFLLGVMLEAGWRPNG